MNINERLHSKGVMNVTTGCLEYTGYRSNGYGIIKYEKKNHKVHRLAYLLAHGEIPEGLVVRHTCDNPSCFNLHHLELGTQRDNVMDMHKRGRSNAVLSTSDIEDIKQSSETSKVLAERYGVSTRRINQIR